MANKLKGMIYLVFLLVLCSGVLGVLNDPKFYYSFDKAFNLDTNRVLDNTLTLQTGLENISAEATNAQVILGESYYFDSSNNEYMRNTSLSYFIPSTSDITVSLWGRLGDLVGSYYFYGMGNNFFILDFNDYSGGNIACTVNDDSGPPITVPDNIVVGANTWYHLVCGYNRTNVYLYIDGVLQGSSAAGTNLDGNLDTLYIGNSPTQAKYFKGYIDEVGVWDRNLGKDEVLLLYNGGVGYNALTPVEVQTGINVTIDYPTQNDFFYSVGSPFYIYGTKNQTNASCSINGTGFSSIDYKYLSNVSNIRDLQGNTNNLHNFVDNDWNTYAVKVGGLAVEGVVYLNYSYSNQSNITNISLDFGYYNGNLGTLNNITTYIPSLAIPVNNTGLSLRVSDTLGMAITIEYFDGNNWGSDLSWKTVEQIIGLGGGYNGFVETRLGINDKGSFNFIGGPLSDGIYNYEVFCNDSDILVNGSDTVTFEVDSFNLVGVNYTGNVIYNSLNYTQRLNYDVYYYCPSGSNTVLNVIINGSPVSQTPITCIGTEQNTSGTFTPTTEGDFNIQFILNYTLDTEKTDNYTAIADLTRPTITLKNITTGGGFFGSDLNFTLTCTDSILDNLNYTINYSGTLVYNSNETSGTNIINQTNTASGLISAVFSCGDLFGNTSETMYRAVYSKMISIIDEATGGPFALSNVTNLTVYLDNNRTKFSFKDEGTSTINFTSVTDAQLRIEIIYGTGDIITRYVDISIDPSDEDLRICANTDDITHYQQIITGSTSRAVTVKSVYANCVVAQDYLRFVYENALVLKAYTRNTLYYLYTYDDNGNKVYLSSMDGSFATYYNVDVLEFNQQGYDIGIVGETIGIQKHSNQTLRFYYRNLDNNSISTTMTITQINNSNVIFTATDTEQPNNFYMLFNYATLGLDENTMYKATVTTEKSNGETATFDKYFTLTGNSGIINNGFAFTIALLLTIFGLTFTVVRISLGWFGIFIQLGSLAILSMAVGNTYTLFLMAVNVIILIYILILTTQQNYTAVA